MYNVVDKKNMLQYEFHIKTARQKLERETCEKIGMWLKKKCNWKFIYQNNYLQYTKHIDSYQLTPGKVELCHSNNLFQQDIGGKIAYLKIMQEIITFYFN